MSFPYAIFHALLLLVFTSSPLRGSDKAIFFARLPIFSSSQNPWDTTKKLSQQHCFTEIARLFSRAGYSLVEESSTDIDSENLIGVISCDFWNRNDIFYSSKYPLKKRVLLLWESPVVLPHQYTLKELHSQFAKVLTMLDDLVDDQKYFKYFYPQDFLQITESLPGFEERKLCTQVSSNIQFSHPYELYSERRKVIDFFEAVSANDFDFYGSKWPNLKNYKGLIGPKPPILKNYRFSFCYENAQSQRGYISEKIFDCFISGCVPIYWGADNITDFIPENCFIDRRKFADTKDVYEYIKSITKEKHSAYLENIRAFLSSPAAYRFSIEYFVDCLAKAIIPEYKRQMIFSSEQIKKLNAVDGLEYNRKNRLQPNNEVAYKTPSESLLE